MIRMWCYHRREVVIVHVTAHIYELRHADDSTLCTGRHPKF